MFTTTETTYFQDRRYELARDIYMKALPRNEGGSVSNVSMRFSTDLERAALAKGCVQWADALLAALEVNDEPSEPGA